MLRALGEVFSQRLRRWIPEPFVFAILLTLLVAAAALWFTDSNPNQVIDHWYRGFWMLLEFGMQMVLMLVTGYAIALSPPVSRMIGSLSRLARTPGGVYLLVLLIGGLFNLVSWGWAVLTAVVARELAVRVRGVDYAYLVALVYLSGQPWVGGLSSSIALLMNTEGNFLIQSGILEQRIPVTATLGSTLNWLYLAMFFLTVPLLMWWLRPRESGVRSFSDMLDQEHQEHSSVAEEAATFDSGDNTPSDRLNNSTLLQGLIAAGALYYVARHFYRNGFDLDLNLMIFLFIGVGLLVHRRPICYVIAMKRACAIVSGIVFQYPFYAGIMGIMIYSGLGSMIADAIASGATVNSLPFFAQLAGALTNFAIPSAGGEWAVIGPPLTEAANAVAAGLGPAEREALIARVAMAAAYGETSTNLLQPFFLLVVLPIMGAGVRIQARDVMGYLVIPFLWIFACTALLVTYAPL